MIRYEREARDAALALANQVHDSVTGDRVGNYEAPAMLVRIDLARLLLELAPKLPGGPRQETPA